MTDLSIKTASLAIGILKVKQKTQSFPYTPEKWKKNKFFIILHISSYIWKDLFLSTLSSSKRIKVPE